MRTGMSDIWVSSALPSLSLAYNGIGSCTSCQAGPSTQPLKFFLSRKGSVLVKFSVAMIKHHNQKQRGEERIFPLHNVCSQSSGQGLKQSQSLEGGADAEGIEQCFLSCSSWFAQPFYCTQDHQPSDGTC